MEKVLVEMLLKEVVVAVMYLLELVIILEHPILVQLKLVKLLMLLI
jgi:hypothetical protein